ncbi:MAG TPA: FGGY-family carbohydrate kinase [Candidatus Didemnitutus sp.]|nr:FGGY-family carbohydrate kinase [Candidatus Didemnitutus sp.]
MSRTFHCAAVDLGATSGRVIVGTWHDNRLATEEVHRFPNQFRTMGGRAYWDLPTLWTETVAGLTLARKKFPRLASVGVDGWAVDHVLVDRKGRPVHPVYAYRDSRTERLSAALGRRDLGRIYNLTGLPNYPYNTSLQLQETLQACPSVARAAARCLFLPEYFNFLLSGRMVNEMSLASHSQLLDVRGSTWSAAALRHFGIPKRWFGRPARSPRILGPVKGLPELSGVKAVLVPGHDTACAFAAFPGEADGSDLYLSCGTWSLLGCESAVPLVGPKALAAKISNERMGDGSFRPLRSCPGLWLLEQTLPAFSARPRDDADWRRLIAAAAGEPRPSTLIEVGRPEFFHPELMRTAIDAHLRRRGARPPRTLAGYVRLICDSLARGHAEAVDVFRTLSGRKFHRLLVVGGGSRNRLLCQATADATGLPVVSLSLEGSAVGNIGSQLIALGALPDLAAFRRHLLPQLSPISYQPGATS